MAEYSLADTLGCPHLLALALLWWRDHAAVATLWRRHGRRAAP